MTILSQYTLPEGALHIESFGAGLINSTWKVSVGGNEYLLQRINTEVFRKPADIDHNICLVAQYLASNHPGYLFIAPLKSNTGESLVCVPDGDCYRLFPFVRGSQAMEVVQSPQLAFEAARQFGRFARLAAGMDASALRITIPRFHDLVCRYEEFLDACKKGNGRRLLESEAIIKQLLGHAGMVDEYRRLTSHGGFKIRVMHHDTKISNVLFDDSGRGLCVVDLDTLMPGYFFSDVGDMMRTYLSPVSEEATDFSQIEIREAYYRAIVDGYLSEMEGELTETERAHFFDAGRFMIYMQALRFMTDHLNNDRYYGSAYAGQNRVRATNQLVLLERLLEKKKLLV